MEERVYKQLLRINRGFAAVVRGLATLEKSRGFHRSELRRLSTRVRETRAAANSYLAATLESAETDEAGRLYAKRLAREKKDEEATMEP